MLRKIRVLVTGGREYSEFIGYDDKRYIHADEDKMHFLPFTTLRKNTNFLKGRLIPFSVYSTEIEV